MHASPRLYRLCTLLQVERIALSAAKNSGSLKNSTHVSKALRDTYLRYCLSTNRPYLEIDKTALKVTLNTSPLNGLISPVSSSINTQATKETMEEVSTLSVSTKKIEEVKNEFAFVKTFLDQLNRDILQSPRHRKLGLQVTSEGALKRQEDKTLPGPSEGSNTPKEQIVELTRQSMGNDNGAFTFYTASKGHALELCETIFSTYKSLLTSSKFTLLGRQNKKGLDGGVNMLENAFSLHLQKRKRAVQLRKLQKIMKDPTAKLRRRLPFDPATVVL